MIKFIGFAVGCALLFAGSAHAATNAQPQIPLVSSGPCQGGNCPGVPNDATHAWFFAPATGAMFPVSGTVGVSGSVAVTGTFWQNTQPVSLASQSAPGTPQTTAITIQGNASGVPVPVTGSFTTTPSGTQNVTGTGTAGSPATGAVTIQGISGGTPAPAVLSPSSASANGIAPIASTAAESSHVLKSSAGNFYSLIVTTGASAGYLMVFDATSAPSDGAVTPKFCTQIAANSSSSISSRGAIPASFSTGIVAVFSTTGCFTKTASATAAFTGMVQ